MRKMSETIPLSTGLRVHNVYVVVAQVGDDCFDFMLKGFTVEGGLVGDVEGETCAG